MSLTPQTTYFALLLVQTAHLLHHRLAKRHISFAEVASSAILCVPLSLGPSGVALQHRPSRHDHRADRR
jgi:hypothetical protein